MFNGIFHLWLMSKLQKTKQKIHAEFCRSGGIVSRVVWVLQVHVGPMRSTSVGWLKLKSSDPNDHPIIEPNYLSTGNAASPCSDVSLFPASFSS